MSVQTYTATEADAREADARATEADKANELKSYSAITDGSVSRENGTSRTGGTVRHTEGQGGYADALPVSGFTTKSGQPVSLSRVDADTLCHLPNGLQIDVALAVEQGILPADFLDNPVKAAQAIAAERRAEAEKEANRRVDIENADDVSSRLISASVDGYDGQVDAVIDAYMSDADPEVDLAGMGKALGLTEKGARQVFQNVLTQRSQAVNDAVAHLVNDQGAFYRWAASEHPHQFRAAFKSVAFNANDTGAFVALAREYSGMHAFTDVSGQQVLDAIGAGKLPGITAVADPVEPGRVLVRLADGSVLDHRTALRTGLLKMPMGGAR